MSNEKWSSWIDWSGGRCPVNSGLLVNILCRDGYENEGPASQFAWGHGEPSPADIIAYRYLIKDDLQWTGPTKAAEGMHPDLEWLARNVSEWGGDEEFPYICHMGGGDYDYFQGPQSEDEYSYAQWLQARKDLGLEDPAWAESVPEGVITDKQLRYLDAKGEDWIDEFARTATVDEFRGAMRFTIGKYVRRAGKKDEIEKELDKIIDYCQRWKGYERETN